MRTILLTIAYDGTDFHGWQVQPGLPTVQGELERALFELTGEKIAIDGTGRTDAGVHALGQCASLRTAAGIPTARLPYALNNLLPGGVRVLKAEERPEGFHARFDAKGKTYRYRLLLQGEDGEPPLFLRHYVYPLREALDLAAMREAATAMEGRYDCACFQAAGGEERESTVRTVYQVAVGAQPVAEQEEGLFPETKTGMLLDIDVSGDGFLYNMVRIMTGTLVDVGRGKIRAADIPSITAGKDRTRAGHTAPPQGLYLKKVYFDEAQLPGRKKGLDR